MSEQIRVPHPGHRTDVAEPVLLTVQHVATQLAVSVDQVYKLIRLGRLHAVRVETAVRVPAASLMAYLRDIGA